MEQSQYIRANKGFSFLCVPREFCAAVVLLWGINPASFLYNWAIYAGVVLLWACFAAASEWKRFWKTVFHPGDLRLGIFDGKRFRPFRRAEGAHGAQQAVRRTDAAAGLPQFHDG